jgi:hypothetical protein
MAVEASENEDVFAPAEETDLNEEELEEHSQRKMSVRAINVLQRFAPGAGPKSREKPRVSMLSHASALIVNKANAERQSKLLQNQSPTSPVRSPVFKPSTDEAVLRKQSSNISNSSEEMVVDEDEQNFARFGHSAHRCSMIKKYNIDTYFLGPSARK